MANRTRSVVWEFFSKGDEANVVKCNICCNILTFFGTTNLLKHLRAKHRDETAEIIQWSTEDGAERTETDVDAQSVRRAKAIEELNESDGTYSPGQQGVRKKRSFAWKCFKKIVGSTLAECLYCGMEMSHWGGSTSALMKHFMVKHPDMYAMHTEAHAEDDDDRNQIGAAKSLNQTQSTEELNESDGMLSLGQKGVRRNRSLAWKCFKKIVGSNVAECLYCGIQLSHVSGATSTLMKHFVVKHSDVYEMHVEGHPKAVSPHCDSRPACFLAECCKKLTQSGLLKGRHADFLSLKLIAVCRFSCLLRSSLHAFDFKAHLLTQYADSTCLMESLSLFNARQYESLKLA